MEYNFIYVEYDANFMPNFYDIYHYSSIFNSKDTICKKIFMEFFYSKHPFSTLVGKLDAVTTAGTL